MSLFIKIMSDCDVPDENNTKPFSIFVIPEGVQVTFDRTSFGGPILSIPEYETGKGGHVELTGNAYVMDGNRTVATFAAVEAFTQSQLDHYEASLRQYGWFTNLKAADKVSFMNVLGAFNGLPHDDLTRERYVEGAWDLPQTDLPMIQECFYALGFEVDFHWEARSYDVAAVSLITGRRVDPLEKD